MHAQIIVHLDLDAAVGFKEALLRARVILGPVVVLQRCKIEIGKVRICGVIRLDFRKIHGFPRCHDFGNECAQLLLGLLPTYLRLSGQETSNAKSRETERNQQFPHSSSVPCKLGLGSRPQIWGYDRLQRRLQQRLSSGATASIGYANGTLGLLIAYLLSERQTCVTEELQMNAPLHQANTRRLGFAYVTILAAGLTLAQVARAEEVTKSFTVSGRPSVHVDTNDGSVRVTSGDAKQVEFRVEYQGYELGKNLRVDARQDGDKVELIARVTGHWGINLGWGHNRRLHIEVRMPQQGDLQVETGDGSVETIGLSGTLNVHTADGSVKASSLEGTIDL